MIKAASKLAIFAFALFAFVGFAIPANTHASSPWNAGRIIDDSIFFNKDSMSVNDIQNFLNARVPVCDTWGTKPSEYGGGTRAQYGASKGYPAPFVCLKDYRENTTTKANNLHGANPGAGAKSAAQIIWEVSQQFNISPRALLVTLHKESDRLMVDDWPWSIQYRAAMGYGCPDSGPNFSANCNASYYGFYNQMYNAARQFRLYANNPQNYRYKAGQNNTIQFNPNPNCGSSSVFIQNQATAGLYNYTPYQPNAATMSVPVGQTAPCGAYGNKNFWYFFNAWFGSTHGMPYAWEPIHQAVYTDLSFQNQIRPPYKLNSGQRVFVTIVARNTGTNTWSNTNNPIMLGTTDPNDRISPRCDNTWPNCARAARLTQNSVPPGGIGTFGFWVTAPNAVGQYTERFNLVAEGITWLNDPRWGFEFETVPTYRWQPTSIEYFLDPERTRPIGNGALVVSQRTYATLRITNTGNVTWQNTNTNPVRMAANNPNDRRSILCSETWDRCGRTARMTESSLAPGQSGTFNFDFYNPLNPSLYGERFNIVIEGQLWTIDPVLHLWMGVNGANHRYTIESLNYYTNESLQTQVNPSQVQPGQNIFIVLKVKNSGNSTFSKNRFTTKLGTANPNDRSSILYVSGWENKARAASVAELLTYPGEIATLAFWIKTPTTKGQHSERFNLVNEGQAWFATPQNGVLLNLNIL